MYKRLTAAVFLLIMCFLVGILSMLSAGHSSAVLREQTELMRAGAAGREEVMEAFENERTLLELTIRHFEIEDAARAFTELCSAENREERHYREAVRAIEAIEYGEKPLIGNIF